MIFQVGDKVRIKEWKEMEDKFGLDRNGNINCTGCFVKNMRQYCGKIFTINSTAGSLNNQSIFIITFKEIDSQCTFTTDMINSVNGI